MYFDAVREVALVDYQKDEHLILSDMWTGTLGEDAVIKHRLEGKVTAWNKAHTTQRESADKREKETLSITLLPTANAREMKAEFDHTVFQDGEAVLRFSGITLLARRE